MSQTTLDVLSEVKDERAFQNKKWGEQNHNHDRWMVILMEEVGEAAREAYESNAARYRAELVQVAAVAVAAIESLDRNDP